MKAYCRTTQHSTAARKILRGAFADTLGADVVLLKGCSLEHFRVTPLSENNRTILTHQFEQSTFGLVSDACTLSCCFNPDEDPGRSVSVSASTPVSELWSDTPYKRAQRPEHERISGDDVIVAVSDYGRLIFWCLRTLNPLDMRQTGRFEVVAEVRLSDPGLEYKKVGKKLAVDPASRAIAVAAYQDRFDIMILNRHMSRTRFDPIAGMGSIVEQGIIWHMEFLHTKDDSWGCIVLAAVVYNDVDQICRVITYAIDASDPKDVTIERVGTLALNHSTPLPVLLVPLPFRHETFMLVTEEHICILTTADVAHGNGTSHSESLSKLVGSTENPLLVAYAIPTAGQFLYLGSAEGQLYKVEVSQTNSTTWSLISTVCTMAPSMHVLGTVQVDDTEENYSADAILCIGEGADSEVVAVGYSKLACTKLQTLVNLAPLVDSLMVDHINLELELESIVNPATLLTCSGQGGSGSLAILSWGVKTRLLKSLDTEGIRLNLIWDVRLPTANSEERRCLVSSSVLGTTLVYINDSQLQDVTETAGIDRQQMTIFASTISIGPQKYIAQVCPEGILLIGMEGLALRWTLQQTNLDQSYEIVFAAAFVFGSYEQMAICATNGQRNLIFILQYVQDTLQSPLSVKMNASMNIEETPSYLGVFNIQCSYGVRSTLVLGTYKPALHLYNIHQDHLEHFQTKDFSNVGASAVPHSAGILLGPTSRLPRHFILGLRQGSIMLYRLNDTFLDETGSRCLLQDSNQACELDLHAVCLTPDNSQEGSLLALSRRLWRIRCDSVYEDMLDIEPVLLPACDVVNSVLHFDTGVPYLEKRTIAVVADFSLYLFELDGPCKLVPRKIKLGETPRRVAFDSSHLQAVVATLSSSDKGHTNKICVAEVEDNLWQRCVDQDSLKEVLLSQMQEFSENTKILSIAEWSTGGDGYMGSFLCVGVGYSRDSSSSRRTPTFASKGEHDHGALHLYRLYSESTTVVANRHVATTYTPSSYWLEDSLPGGVSAMCSHPKGLLVAAGATLLMYQLIDSNRKAFHGLREVARKFLRFPITSITVNLGNICVATQTNSVSFYVYCEDTMRFEVVASDRETRTIHHAHLVDQQIVAGASMSGGIVGLLGHTDDDLLEQGIDTIFSVHHPEIVVKPSRGALRPQRLICHLSPEVKHHLDSWSFDGGQKSPVIGCTVAGGVLTVQLIGRRLFNLLEALQERLMHYGPTSPLLGSPTEFLSWYSQLSGNPTATIHGDATALFLRLSSEQQRAVISSQRQEFHTNMFEALQQYVDVCFWHDGPSQKVAEWSMEKVVKTVCRLIYQLEKYI